MVRENLSVIRLVPSFLIVNMQPAMCGKGSKLSYTSVKTSAYYFLVQLDAASAAAMVGNAGVYTKRLRRRQRTTNQQALRLQALGNQFCLNAI